MAESREKFYSVLNAYNIVFRRGKLKVNVGKSNAIGFERARKEVTDFGKHYRVRVHKARES